MSYLVDMDVLGNIVSENIDVGDNIKVGCHCVIHDDVIIGNNVEIRSYVELRPGTIIGDNCYIDSGVKMSGKCTIGNNVTIRYDSIIARGCIIEDDVYIAPQVMFNNLNHNRVQIGGAHVGAGCFIGTNATLAAGIKIAPGTIIGAKSLVTKDITEPGIYVGIPARRVR